MTPETAEIKRLRAERAHYKNLLIIFHQEIDKLMANSSDRKDSVHRIAEVGEYLNRREEEIERLRAICPTEWKVGPPDWGSLRPEDTIRYIDDNSGSAVSCCVMECNQSSNYWNGRQYQIWKYTPPPKPERVYTEKDLPHVGGMMWAVYEGDTFYRIEYYGAAGRLNFVSRTKSEAIRAAREWFQGVRDSLQAHREPVE